MLHSVFVICFSYIALARSKSQDEVMCELSDLYNSDTSGKPRGKGWSCKDGAPSIPVCNDASSWTGVTCENGKVIKLRINHKNLQGTIPASLGDLTSLKSLLLYQANLHGNIPPSLGNLKDLEFLSLQGNSLSGPIPGELSKLTQLKELWLSSNQLSGEVPAEIQVLSQVTFIGLSKNKLTGQIPSFLGHMESLRSIHLDHNNFHGIIPQSICSSTSLSSIYLYWYWQNIQQTHFEDTEDLDKSPEDDGPNNQGLVCYPSCLARVRDRRFGSLPLCTPADLRSEKQSVVLESVSVPAAVPVVRSEPEAGAGTLPVKSCPVSGVLDMMTLLLPAILPPSTYLTLEQSFHQIFNLMDCSHHTSFLGLLETYVGNMSDILNSLPFPVIFRRIDVSESESTSTGAASNYGIKHKGMSGRTTTGTATATTAKTNTSSRRKTSGIFFYRRSLGATVAVAVGLAVFAGVISYSIASAVFVPADRQHLHLQWSLSPGAHPYTAAAA